MCGITGYLGPRQALPIILDGLKRLEYRGYDSSGVAILEPGAPLFLHKGAGKLEALSASMPRQPAGGVGIGHTRWATHGKPTLANSHPHTDCSGAIAVVHNGIVENHRQLKDQLVAEGHVFKSETDTEVIPHLIESVLARGADLVSAVQQAMAKVQGAQAIAVVSKLEPDKIIGVRTGHAGGLAVGFGRDEVLLASDLPAMIAHVTSVAYLANGEMAVLRRDGVTFCTLDGTLLQKQRHPIQQDPVSAAKGPHRHFMLKEIMEQPETLISALRDRLDVSNGRVSLTGFPFSDAQVRGFKRVMLIGMGTSAHATMAGRFMIESLARIPCQTDNASEFRYREPLMGPETLLVSVTQSGESVETIAPMAEAKQQGIPQIAVSNVAGSEATRLANYTLLINAGPEIGVASTKTFTGSLVCLYLLAIYLGQVRGTLDGARVSRMVEELVRLPELMGRIVDRSSEYEAMARRYFHASNFMLLGRGVNYPVALEGALKLKEISYIHAEGYQAGEMKHGPIALIDENMPVLALALKDRMYDKMLSNIEEVRARDGKLIAIVTDGDTIITEKVKDVISIPQVSDLVAPILAIAPLQLLAYHIAVRRGCDVDQPRNLAKTVTVE